MLDAPLPFEGKHPSPACVRTPIVRWAWSHAPLLILALVIETESFNPSRTLLLVEPTLVEDPADHLDTHRYSASAHVALYLNPKLSVLQMIRISEPSDRICVGTIMREKTGGFLVASVVEFVRGVPGRLLVWAERSQPQGSSPKSCPPTG